MRTLDFNTVLRTAVLAGLVAAVAVALFHQVATEPLIDAAIEIEESRAAAHATGEAAEGAPVVSRDAQRIGLMVGVPLYGVAMGILFCIAFFLVQRLRPGLDPIKRGALLGLAGYWCLALAPFLKYPANPPGVGDPETIQARVFLDLAMKVLLLAAAAASFAVAGRGSLRPWMLVVANVLFGAVLFAVLPVNTDPVAMPGGLLLQFRALSLAGLTLLWGLMTALFVWQLKRSTGEGPAGAALTGPAPA